MLRRSEGVMIWIALILASVTISVFLNVFIGIMFLIAALIFLVFLMRRGIETVVPNEQRIKYECIMCGMPARNSIRRCRCGSTSFKVSF